MTKSIQKDLVSIIIPVYNGEEFIAEALESISAQTYENYEVIVVDDGSTDNTRKIVESFEMPINYSYQQNAGTSAARNNGIERSNGEFIAFLDADDYWTKSKLEKQMSILTNKPEVDAVVGQVRNVHQSNWNSKESLDDESLKDTISGFFPGALLIRRKAFLKVGNFDSKYNLGEVVDWFARAKEIGINIEVLSDLQVWRRIHKTNKGIQNKTGSTKDYLRALKQSIDRRRKLKVKNEK